jgi:transcriptional regulator with XRE-family HTH domain
VQDERELALQVALGERIRELRKKSGYSQEGFADAAGVHRTYMGTLERGEANVSLSNISKISTALGIALSELFRGVDKRAEALRKHGVDKRT